MLSFLTVTVVVMIDLGRESLQENGTNDHFPTDAIPNVDGEASDDHLLINPI